MSGQNVMKLKKMKIMKINFANKGNVMLKNIQKNSEKIAQMDGWILTKEDKYIPKDDYSGIDMRDVLKYSKENIESRYRDVEGLIEVIRGRGDMFLGISGDYLQLHNGYDDFRFSYKGKLDMLEKLQKCCIIALESQNGNK